VLTYFIKVDTPTNPEMATAADVMGALFLYAAGYNVASNETFQDDKMRDVNMDGS